MPHSDIRGSQPAGGSPRLIAAIHVLHRLLVPRHPPCALASSASRSLESTKPAGSMFSKRPNSSIYRWSLLRSEHCSRSSAIPTHRQACAAITTERHHCLLNYSSVLQVRTQKTARRPSSHQQAQARESRRTRLCGWRLHSTYDLVLPRRLLCALPGRASGTALCAAQRKITLPACLGRMQAVCGHLTWLAGVEPRGFEPLTSAVQRRRSPN